MEVVFAGEAAHVVCRCVGCPPRIVQILCNHVYFHFNKEKGIEILCNRVYSVPTSRGGIQILCNHVDCSAMLLRTSHAAFGSFVRCCGLLGCRTGMRGSYVESRFLNN